MLVRSGRLAITIIGTPCRSTDRVTLFVFDSPVTISSVGPPLQENLLTDRKSNPPDPRKVIDARHPGLRIMGLIMTVEGILLTLAMIAMYLYKRFH